MKTKKIRRRYRGFKLTLNDEQDSFWVDFENKYFQDCTKRTNDAESAFDIAKDIIDTCFTTP